MKQILNLLFLASLAIMSQATEPTDLHFCADCGYPSQADCEANPLCQWSTTDSLCSY
jgi:hypothetical protein